MIKDEHGQVMELRCEWDPASRGGDAPDGRKVRGTVHWVSAAHAIDAEVRQYERLFTVEDPMQAPDGKDFLSNLNPASVEVLRNCKLEPCLGSAKPGECYQFERIGYYCVDPSTAEGTLRFNRTLSLKDGWAKLEKKLTAADSE